MKKKLLNYYVLIKEDRRTGTGKPCFSAFVPILGIAADGDSVEETLENIKETIRFHIECLVAEGEEVPTEERGEPFITTASVPYPAKTGLSSNL